MQLPQMDNILWKDGVRFVPATRAFDQRTSHNPTPPAWGHTGTPNLRFGATYVSKGCCIGTVNLLRSHQQHGQYLADASQATRINLNNVDSLCLEELLEDHSIVSMFSCSDSNSMWFKSLPYGCVSKNVIGSSRLLDEPALV